MGRLGVAAACALGLGAFVPGVPASDKGAVVSPVGVPIDPLVSGWAEQLGIWLELLIDLLGGTNVNLSPDPYSAMAQVSEYYALHGVPTDLTSAERAAGRAEVEAAWILTDPIVAGSDVRVVNFRRTLKKLYADLGGDPGRL